MSIYHFAQRSVWYRFEVVNFRPWGRGMGCLLWVLSLIYILIRSLFCCMYCRIILAPVITAPDCIYVSLFCFGQHCDKHTSRQLLGSLQETRVCRQISLSDIATKTDPFVILHIWHVFLPKCRITHTHASLLLDRGRELLASPFPRRRPVLCLSVPPDSLLHRHCVTVG